MKKTIILALSLILSVSASAQRYCNPLPMPLGEDGVASGDVSVFLDDDGTYYMYCTGGGAWVSKDLLDWEYHYVPGIVTAPDVHKYNGKYYMTGNDITIWESDSPLGPFHDLGPFKNTGGPELGWKVPFDSMFFVDDDGTPYLFWPGRGRTGIYGAELDKNDLTRFVAPPTHLFSYNPTHWFEHFGEANEYQNVSWIEGPWVFKKDGIYYCAYSCSGTQWKSYAAGYYTATSPLGPYTFGPNNPLLRDKEGIVQGPSHGSIVLGPDGNYWAFYTVIMTMGGRRIGMDKVVFDDYGNISVKATETPQPAPLAKPGTRDGKSVPISLGKVARGRIGGKPGVSSEQPGFYSSYAVDDYSGTIWKPDPSDKEPYLTFDLSTADGINTIDLFDVDGLRIIFGNNERGRSAMPAAAPAQGQGARPVAPAARPAARPAAAPARQSFPTGGGMFMPAGGLPVYKYKLEGSMDGENFYMLVDKTDNTKITDNVFEDITPRQCRYVRLTITGWPEGINLGVIEATVFGRYSGFLPPTNPQENDRYLFNY